ncbi:integrase [Sphingomonas glaciei]|uniref:Site-specific integrase n=1 Tax=Sphingomonas glaciei TaxID=2938948 RepID=A0ABY5MY77_9SPHN|nr:site-specific integrase [Sphingomonas glaciei]UUR08282.1 site-specific integrase [Sphingomonas glaciei]
MATITKRKNGWSVQIRRKGYPQQTRTLPTKVEAQAWAREQEGRIDRALAPLNLRVLKGTTLRDILERYIREVSPTKDSVYTEAARLKKVLREQAFCDLALADLNSRVFADYRTARLAKVKPGTVHRELGLIRHALEVARHEWDIDLPSNPLDRVKRPQLANARDRRLAHGEYERLKVALKRTRNPLVASVVEFAIQTAMRRGEILALKWEQVNWHERTAFIADSKTGVPRTIPLLDGALAVLRQLRPELACGRVFPMSTEALKQAWERARDRAELGDLHFHDLRHEGISRLCEMGLTLPEVALISGHKDPRMLFRYVNLRPADLAKKLIGREWRQV